MIPVRSFCALFRHGDGALVCGEDSASSLKTHQQGVSYLKQTFKPGFCGWGTISPAVGPSHGPINPPKYEIQIFGAELLIQLITPWCEIQIMWLPCSHKSQGSQWRVKHPGYKTNLASFQSFAGKVGLHIIASKYNWLRKVRSPVP